MVDTFAVVNGLKLNQVMTGGAPACGVTPSSQRDMVTLG